jgi:diguanylate cyclase (GGDEF)-like protein
MPGATESKAIARGEALRGMVCALAIPHPAGGGSVTVSVGVAEKSNNACDEAALVREADIALYQAKRLGRDRTVAASSLEMRIPIDVAQDSEMISPTIPI